MKRRTPVVRFNDKFVVDDVTGCWLWVGATNRKGYGSFSRGGRDQVTAAHRWSYEHFVGPIPEGKQLDHTCRIRRCVNPAHLEAVTSRENSLRGVGIPALNAAKTHCPQGHPFDEANTYVYPNQSRACRRCRREYVRAHRARKAMAA